MQCNTIIILGYSDEPGMGEIKSAAEGLKYKYKDRARVETRLGFEKSIVDDGLTNIKTPDPVGVYIICHASTGDLNTVPGVVERDVRKLDILKPIRICIVACHGGQDQLNKDSSEDQFEADKKKERQPLTSAVYKFCMEMSHTPGEWAGMNPGLMVAGYTQAVFIYSELDKNVPEEKWGRKYHSQINSGLKEKHAFSPSREPKGTHIIEEYTKATFKKHPKKNYLKRRGKYEKLKVVFKKQGENWVQGTLMEYSAKLQKIQDMFN